MSSLSRIVSFTVLFILTLSIFSACAGEETAAEAWSRIEAGAVLIDVRSAEEYAGGHLEGSINIPHTELDAIAEAIGDPEKSTVVYCRSGRRSGFVQTNLQQRGFSDVYNGLGYEELKAKALATH
jgi:phage shock protein E